MHQHSAQGRDRGSARFHEAVLSITGVGLVPVLVLALACSAWAEPPGPAKSRRGIDTGAGAGIEARVGARQAGKAAWYGARFQGRKTASGERFNKRALTGAHRTLPFGTVVRVKNLKNQRVVKVRINDRGPWKKKFIIDVSEAAAQILRMRRAGTAQVEIEVVSVPRRSGRRRR